MQREKYNNKEERRSDYERRSRVWERPESERDRYGFSREPSSGWGREREEWARPDYERERQEYGRTHQEYGQERLNDMWERERQGAGGYGYGRKYWNQEWDRDDNWKRRDDRTFPGYGYRPSHGYDWWDGRSDIASSGYGARFGYHRDYDRERWGSADGQHTGQGPKGYQRSDERIREDIRERLTQHPTIDAGEIEVEVKNCEVTLKGAVDDRQAKRMAEDVAESCSGVKEVHNQLRVAQGQHQNGQSQTGQQGLKGRTTA